MYKSKIYPVIVCIFLTFLLYFIFHHFDYSLLHKEVHEINPGYLLFSIFILFFIPIIKSFQWEIVLNSIRVVPLKNIFKIMSIRLLLVNLLPLWTGEALTVYLMNKREEINKTAVISIITVDQLAEGFSVLVLFAVSAWAPLLPLSMKLAMKTVTIVAAFISITVFLIANFSYRDNHKLLQQDKSLFNKFFFYFLKWAYHLKILKNAWKTSLIFMLGLAVKTIEIVSLVILSKGLGISTSLWAPLLAIAALHLSLTLPLTPGNIGVFEAGLFIVYQHIGLDQTHASLLAFLFHFIYLLTFVITGYFSLLTLKIPLHTLLDKKQRSMLVL